MENRDIFILSKGHAASALYSTLAEKNFFSKDWLKKYDHPLWIKYGEHAMGAGHGGMDFFVINAFVESAKQNIAPPMDAYDAAAWSAITPLSELSIENNGEPQSFPDFTRGLWVKRKPYNWIKDSY